MGHLRKKVSVLLGDLVLVVALVTIVAGAVGVRDPLGPATVIVCLLGAFFLSGLYELEHGGFRSQPLMQIVVACMLAGITVATLDFLLAPLLVSRRLLIGSLSLVALGLAPWRLLLERGEKRDGRFRMPVVVLGNGSSAEAVSRLLDGHALFDLRSTIPGPLDGEAGKDALAPLVAEASLQTAMFRPGPPTLVVLKPRTLRPSDFETLVDLRRRGVRVADLPAFWAEATGRLPVSHLSHEWLALRSEILPDQGPAAARAKRTLDVLGALVLLLLLTIPTLFAALALWIGDRGRVLFRQPRVGRHGERFDIMKLRTMRMGAEGEGPAWTFKNDPRITRVGRWVRRTRLDEVPQLVNVLRGDMSLVGPRPEAVALSERYGEEIAHYTLRHLVRPGLTGWAQVHFPNTASVADARTKLEYDLYYVHRMSFVLDLRILLKTVYVVMFGMGSL